MPEFSYVYILVSKLDPAHHYVGLTDNLKDRLRRHNAGKISHTAAHRLWKLQTTVAFRDRKKAAEFEKYLKTHSGRTSARRHF